jgi:glycosyltransferase
MGNRISIITAVLNRRPTISAAIESVLSQTGADIEYIVVDGNSTDGTDEVIQGYSDRISRYIREPDAGIYDALNKGVKAATGDIIGFLHADDWFSGPDVLASVAEAFCDPSLDAAYGDLVYVSSHAPEHVIRYWKSGEMEHNRFRWGWMPPHPTVYLRRECYENYGLYRSDFRISADYEMMIRMFYNYRLQTRYIDRVLVRMRLGGISNGSLANRLLASQEDRRAWAVNGLRPPFGIQFLKPLCKLRQFWERP